MTVKSAIAVVAVLVVGTFVLDHTMDTTRGTAQRLQKMAQREAAARAAAGPQNVERTMLLSADRRTLPPSGRLTIAVEYGDGAFYVYDRRRLADFQDGEAWLSALKRGQALDRLSGASGGVIAVLTCCEGSDGPPLTIRVRPRAPRHVSCAYDGVTDHDLDLATGDLVFQPNGDGSAQLLVHVPPGHYRARVSERLGSDGDTNANERFRLDLWTRTTPRPSRVIASPQ